MSTHSKLSAVPDEDLTFKQFGQAAICMLEAMRYCNWDPSHIEMFISFWGNIEKHPWQYSCITHQQRALLVYQEQQCLNWHKTVSSPNAFSLAVVNEMMLITTLNDLKDSTDEQQAKFIQEVSLTIPVVLLSYHTLHLMVHTICQSCHCTAHDICTPCHCAAHINHILHHCTAYAALSHTQCH
ncbi:hypothetical protein J3R82DRAFT_4746 [Butyriboletus roseoflavus]|nr:hypothetical protein J3R82DRAFT_4746 [Butyriboletus roseoflavus]